jgi:Zn-dependent peptidase ImmA (M78 family)
VLVPGVDYVIRIIPLPDKVNGFVTYDDENRANIYINSNLDRESQRKTVLHELRHVLENDVSNDVGIQQVEQGRP